MIFLVLSSLLLLTAGQNVMEYYEAAHKTDPNDECLRAVTMIMKTECSGATSSDQFRDMAFASANCYLQSLNKPPLCIGNECVTYSGKSFERLLGVTASMCREVLAAMKKTAPTLAVSRLVKFAQDTIAAAVSATENNVYGALNQGAEYIAEAIGYPEFDPRAALGVAYDALAISRVAFFVLTTLALILLGENLRSVIILEFGSFFVEAYGCFWLLSFPFMQIRYLNTCLSLVFRGGRLLIIWKVFVGLARIMPSRIKAPETPKKRGRPKKSN